MGVCRTLSRKRGPPASLRPLGLLEGLGGGISVSQQAQNRDAKGTPRHSAGMQRGPLDTVWGCKGDPRTWCGDAKGNPGHSVGM